MTKLNKSGDEHFILLPENGQTVIPAGNYYLMVVSEGQSPSGSYAGSGSSSATLRSLGEAPVTDLGTVPLAGEITHPSTFADGEIQLVQFDVPAGLLALEIALTDPSGSPQMYLRTDSTFPYGPAYGIYSGNNDNYSDTSFITVANPAAGTYSLTLGSSLATPPAGAYTLHIRARTATELAFDAGMVTGVVIPPKEWRFYHVTVPAQLEGEDVLGWEIRTTSWSGQSPPYLSIRRDLAPMSPTPYWYYPYSYTNWPSGNQWTTSGGDWSGYYYNPTATQNYPQYLLSMAMNRPLTAGGSYYISLYNPSTTTTGTFSLVSSAIGNGMTYETPSIAFNGGSVAITNLAAHGVAYFKVEVPAGQPSWSIRLENTSGETSVYARKGYVPTWSMSSYPTYSPDQSISYMTQLQKTGDEYFTLLPASGQTMIPSGTYYLMVVSEGQNPGSNRIGTGSADAVLHSLGNAVIQDLGVLPGAGEINQPDSYVSGAINLYQFEVPIGVLALEVRLEDRVGNPEMNLRLDGNFPNGTSYGSYSGYAPAYQNASLITVANPAPGTYSLLVNDLNSAASLTNGAYTLRIITSGTTDIPFDGGGDTAVTLAPLSCTYYKVQIPEQVRAQDVLGWELRVTEWSGTRPYMAVRRDQLPEGTGTWYYPNSSTSWASGNQWTTSSDDWSHYYYDPTATQSYPQYLLSMGMDRPLSAGTYYIGFYNSSAAVPAAFSFTSKAIGNGMSYDPQPIAFNGGSATITDLPAHNVAYFTVEIPTNTASWKIKLENTSGETALYVRKGYVPTWSQSESAIYSPAQAINLLTQLQKADNEHFVLLPASGQTTIPAGTYYLMVVSEGQVPVSNRIGDGSASAILRSLGEESVVNLGTIPLAGSTTCSNSFEAGEVDLYQFTVPAGARAIEMRLEEVSGDPRMHMRTDGNLPNGLNYGLYSAYGYNYYSESIITIPNPSTGTWSMVVGDPDSSSTLNNSSYRLVVEDVVPPALNVDAALNTNGNSNADSGLLEDNERAYYRVEVPETLDGEPVLGWYLKSSVTQGSAQIRVRKLLLPDDSGGDATQTPAVTKTLVVTPPRLTPGTWYVEVKAVGATDYTLTSTAVRMEREWTMPAAGEPITTPGLSAPLFGDSGVNEAGIPLPIDQGVDLDNGFYHFYAVTIPDSNTGLLRTVLEAISGNPNLYIRVGDVPTLDYNSPSYTPYYDRYLTGSANTEYGNWVPVDGRYEHQLTAGTWYIMVKAEGGSNARYRLKLAGGNTYTNGNVQELALDGGSYTGQLLADNDWRHYRVVIPTNAPANWNITYSQTSGNVDLFIRDTVPAGNSQYFSDSYTIVRDWKQDLKNTGTPRPWYEFSGTYTIQMPPMRPGHVYYLSFVAKSDASFSVSSGVSGGTIPTYEMVDFETGVVSTNIPAGATVTYQVDVPADAVRWIHSTTNTAALAVYLEQGTLPSKTSSDHWYRTTGSGSLNQYLLNSGTGWPWKPGYTYYFTVVNPGATPEPFTLVMSGSTAAEIPQNLAAGDGTYADHIYISWSSISGVSSYELWRNTINDKASATNLASGTSYSYNDYAVDPGQIYYYWASVNGVTNTAWFSAADSGWVPGTGAISPDGRTHDAGGGTGTIDVTASGGEHWTASESLNWITLLSGTPGTNNGTVSYSVSAYAGDTARTGTISVAGQSFTVVQEAFGVPANVQATDGAYADRTEVTWTPLAGATRYYLYRNVTNDTAGASSLGYVTNNIYNDIGGITDRTYFYWVRPYNSGGTGSYSLYDTGSRGFGGVTPDWIAFYFPGGYPGDLADSDGDGIDNLEEFISGTNPGDPASVFEVNVTGPSPAGFIINWNSITGRVYGIKWTDSLLNPFQTLTNGLLYPQNSWTDTVHSVTNNGFYKINVQMQ
jgi:hypothetical protein